MARQTSQEYIEDKLDRIIVLLEAIQPATENGPADEEEETVRPVVRAKKGNKHAAPVEEEEEVAPVKRRGKGKKAPAAEAEHTVDDIRELCVTVSEDADDGKNKIVALLKRFGCKKLADLEEDKYDEFYTQLEAINEGGEDPF